MLQQHSNNPTTLSDGASLGVEMPDAVDFPTLTDIGLTLLQTDVDLNVDMNSRRMTLILVLLQMMRALALL